jgi:hypothetical protein
MAFPLVNMGPPTAGDFQPVNVLARPPAGDRRNDHTLMPAKKKPHTLQTRSSDGGSLHVRFGSLADICSAKGHVRFAPNSDRESGFPANGSLSIDRTNSAMLRSRRAKARLHRGACMKIATAFLASIISVALPAAAAMAADAPPQWAYPANNPNYKPPVDDGRPVRVPDSTAGYGKSSLSRHGRMSALGLL